MSHTNRDQEQYQIVQNLKTGIAYALESMQYHIIQAPHLDGKDEKEKQILLANYQSQLIAVVELYQKSNNQAHFDLVCKYMLQFEIEPQQCEDIVEPVPKYFLKYGTISEVEHAKNQKIDVTACRIIGIKCKKLPILQFVSAYKNNQQSNRLVSTIRTQCKRRNNIQLRQNYAVRRFGKKQKRKSSRSSSASLEQIAAQIQKSKALKAKSNKYPDVKVQTESAIKRKLQIVESDDSPVQQIDTQKQKILQLSKSKQKYTVPDKNSKQERKITRKRSKNKQKSRQTKLQKLKQIEEADHSQQLSNKKNKISPVQNKYLYNNQKVQQIKKTDTQQFKKPVVDKNDDSEQVTDLNSKFQSQYNKNTSNSITDPSPNEIIRQGIPKFEKNISNEHQSQRSVSQNVLKKIIKLSNRAIQNDNHFLSEEQHEKIVEKLLAPGPTTQQLNSNVNINTNSNMVRSKSIPSSSNSNSKIQTNNQKPKKNKKQAMPANNTTLDQFFLKKK